MGSSIVNFIKVRVGFLGAMVVAALIGGLTSAAVLAAIPDSNGVIHGCIRSTNNNLRIIDTEAGQTCATGQTPINWDQSGWRGYGYIRADGTLDTTKSKNVISVAYGTYNGSSESDVLCIRASFDPALISATSSYNGGTVLAGVKGDDAQSGLDAFCSPTDNIIIQGQAQGVYFFFR